MGRDSVAVMATGYGFDGAGIESRRRRVFPHLPIPKVGPTLYKEQRVFLGAKAAGAWC